MRTLSDGVSVAGFRVFCSRFMDIPRDIDIKLTDIEMGHEKISMFV